jgi:hypothetical protein
MPLDTVPSSSQLSSFLAAPGFLFSVFDILLLKHTFFFSLVGVGCRYILGAFMSAAGIFPIIKVISMLWVVYRLWG